MRRTSLVKAKAHLSEKASQRLMTQTEAEAFLDEIASAAPKSTMSLDDALGRGRLDPKS
jgi:hypothetical protein